MKLPLIPTFYTLLDQTLYLLIYDQRFLGNEVKQNKTELKTHKMSYFLLLLYTHSLSKTSAQGDVKSIPSIIEESTFKTGKLQHSTL